MKILRLTIKEIREARGLSLKQAARLSGISANAIRTWENATRNPSELLTFNKLLKVYGINLRLQQLQSLGYALDMGTKLGGIKFKVVDEDG